MTGGQRAVGTHRRHRREVDDLLGDPVGGIATHRRGQVHEPALVRGRPDHHPAAARLAGRLEHELIDPRQRRLALLEILEPVGRDVRQQRLLAEVEADHLRHVAVDRLVVGDAGADRVGDRHVPGAIRADQPRHPEQRVGAELERVDEGVVEPAVDRVDARQAARRAHVADVVADDQIGGLDQLDAHLAGQEGVLEVGAVGHSRRPDDDRCLAVGDRRNRAQSGVQQRRILIDRANPEVGEQRRDQPRHRDPVLEHVGDPRRGAHVVLEHLPAVLVAHQVAAGDVGVHAARRANAVCRPREVRAAGDQRPGDDPGLDDLALVVDVVDELVERADPLREPAFDRPPLGARDDPRDEVERERPVHHLAVGAGQIEGDPLAHEDRVAQRPGGDEVLGAETVEFGDQRLGVLARDAVGGEDLVEGRRPFG